MLTVDGWGGGLAADPLGQPGQSISLTKVARFEDLCGRPGNTQMPQLRPVATAGAARAVAASTEALKASRSLFPHHVPRPLLKSILRAGGLNSTRGHTSRSPCGPAHRYGPRWFVRTVAAGRILLPGVLLVYGGGTLGVRGVSCGMQACARHKRDPPRGSLFHYAR